MYMNGRGVYEIIPVVVRLYMKLYQWSYVCTLNYNNVRTFVHETITVFVCVYMNGRVVYKTIPVVVRLYMKLYQWSYVCTWMVEVYMKLYQWSYVCT